MINIRFIKLSQNAKAPKRGTPDAAGYDLFACVPNGAVQVLPGKTELIRTGIAIELPNADMAAFIYARSGLAVKSGIIPANCVGVVDADYRGEVCVGIKNTSDKIFTVNDGDRIAQMVIAPVIQAEFVQTDKLSETDRGEGGFGSTGVSEK